jgi:hypothetical protein|eukprot:COSAG06_NODE_462_length_15394_cov_16.361164_17_plen_133_part_00
MTTQLRPIKTTPPLALTRRSRWAGMLCAPSPAAEALLQHQEVRDGRPTWFPVVIAYTAAGEFDSVYCASLGCSETTVEQLVEFTTEKVEEERRLDALAAKYDSMPDEPPRTTAQTDPAPKSGGGGGGGHEEL